MIKIYRLVPLFITNLNYILLFRLIKNI